MNEPFKCPHCGGQYLCDEKENPIVPKCLRCGLKFGEEYRGGQDVQQIV